MNRFDYNKPNTRERIAARRKAHGTRDGSAVRPGLRRVVESWFVSGRAASLVLFIGAVGALVYVFSAQRFTVQDVRVEGAQAMNSRAVVELTGAVDQPIWFVDTGQIVERLKTSAYVEQAEAYLALPDQLTVIVSERRPEVRWRSGGRLYLVDASGRVLDSDAAAPITDTLVIEDRSTQLLEPNDQIDPDALKLGQLLALRLPAELGITPTSIGWDIGTGVFVTTPAGQTIIFGQTENLDSKLAILGTLLEDGTAFTYLDLRPSTPFYRNDASGTPSPEATPTP